MIVEFPFFFWNPGFDYIERPSLSMPRASLKRQDQQSYEDQGFQYGHPTQM